MKKITVLFMSILLVFTVAACGKQDSGNSSQASQPSGGDSGAEVIQDTSGQPDEVPAEMPSENSGAEKETAGEKTLVVYYSASGNTKTVAGYIADAVNADLFELIPAEPYSDADLDWTDDGSRVVYEHDNPDNRDVELVETSVAGWDSYDTVFIGYPIWWGIAAWPVDSFIETNDFTGKTVIPFCTSSSSGLGESGELLAEAAGTGNWLEGERFSSSPSEEDVRIWAQGFGL
ncbi:MAG: flavodoxin [Eubacterium sp.]|nr:flavodoxin [Eubacterium sp.]